MTLNKPNDQKTTQELIQTAHNEEDEDNYWDIVATLQFRGNLDVLESASKLCESSKNQEIKLGVNILGQLGIPNRTFPDECVNILLTVLAKASDVELLNSTAIALSHHQNNC